MRLPIRARLTLVSAALMAVLLVALGAFLYVRLRADLLEAVDAGLRSRADVLVQRLGEDPSLEGGGLSEPDDAFAQVLAGDGRLLESSPGLIRVPMLSAAELATVTRARFFDADVRTVEEPVRARLLAVPTTDGRVVLVGAALDDVHDALSRLLVQLAVGGPVAVALASGVGWLVAGAALRPVERLRVEAEAVSASEPGRRLFVPDTRDELARLAESLNRMLARLEEGVERERRFVGDASHELRTPLANLRAELELALRGERAPEELRRALRSAGEESERVIRLAEDLLVLARAEGGRIPVRREDVDVGAVIAEIVGAFHPRASECGVTLEHRLDGARRARVDEARVRQAVGNLVDNALRHTPSGGRVTVDAALGDGVLTIEVADTGEGFPPAFLPVAFEPFSRADAARARADGGTGLGLAIVRAVAEAHGGTVEAANGPHGGAVVVVRLPG